MSENYNPPNKSALLDVIITERGNLESFLLELTDSQMVETGVEADWSIKDIMAHIAAWERLAHDRIHAALTGKPLKFPVIKGDDFVDKFNADVYQRNVTAPLEIVQSEFQASYQDFMALIETLEDDFLFQKLPFDWAGDLTAQILISANTHWHYFEHAASIEKWLHNYQ
jgi:hypothetical protein